MLQEDTEEISIPSHNLTYPHNPPIVSDLYQDVIKTCEDTTNPDECEPEDFDIDSCPPGYYQISSNNTQYCYEVGEPSAWDSPCFKSGGASVITEFGADELDSLFSSLASKHTSRYFWLPAHRRKGFNPIVWMIPGPYWNRPLESSDNLQVQSSIYKGCLLLDLENRVIITETCSFIYPSLCFYINDHYYPAVCPDGYQAFRFMPDDGVCFGLEESASPVGSSLTDFLSGQCRKPMGNNDAKILTRYIYHKMANLMNFSSKKWCWFFTTSNTSHSQFGGVINSEGELGYTSTMARLPCMACEKSMIYGEPQLSVEYNYAETKMYLTVYYSAGLWKYYNTDKGVRCFTNAKGFTKQVPINDSPYIDSMLIQGEDKEVYIDKTVYAIDLVSNRTAQYWCQGHSKNFSLIATNVLTVNPTGNQEHVFALIIKFNTHGDLEPEFDEIVNKVAEIVDAKRAYLMDIIDMTLEYTQLLIHLHTTSTNTGNQTDQEMLLSTFDALKNKAENDLPQFNFTFVNLSSSIFCFPATSHDIFLLEWEMTPIGQITAPKQFCLQANGLPVNRRCTGSYLYGSMWGPVDGKCDKIYMPSNTTTYLYKLAKGMSDSTNFLTEGLHYVLEDVEIIIPADIYYLAISLNHVSVVAQENKTSIEMGDLENIAWAVDRLMVLDTEYLGLAQTLNSTNLILDSVSELLEVFAMINVTDENNEYVSTELGYQIAVKDKFVVQISYPNITNITGIALVGSNKSDLFTDMKIKPLYVNTSINEVLTIENLELATWVPENVLSSLKKSDVNNTSNNTDYYKQGLHVVIQIFHNDAVFQELSAANNTVNSRIIDVSIPGFASNLEHYIPLVFKDKTNVGKSNQFCGFWDFGPIIEDGLPGHWRKDGCFFAKSFHNLTICECYHLTHFAQLISIGGYGKDRENVNMLVQHKRALNVITLVGSFLSLLGISGLFITAVLFSAWREKPGTKILLQLSTAIAIPLIIIMFFSLDDALFTENDGVYSIADNLSSVCIGLGALLHYSILSSFVWMLITAFLQFIRYVKVLSPTRSACFMLKISLIGWGLPTLPVICLLVINKEHYLPAPSDSYTRSLCYPTGISLILGVFIPVGVILVTNVTLFLLIMFSISRGPNGTRRASDMDLVKAQLRLSVFLFFLLGLTWLFGIFSFLRSVWWSYMFCLTSTLQGFVLFIYFVICDPATRSLWSTLIKPQFRFSAARESICTTSSNINIDLKN